MELDYDKTILVVRPEWGSTGIWHPQKNGESGTLGRVNHDDIGLPESLALQFNDWIEWYNDATPTDGRAKSFDFDAFELQGLSLAHALAQSVGDRFTVEYRGNKGTIIVNNTNFRLKI